MCLLTYDLWKRTAHNERNVNIKLHVATWKMITLLYSVCYDEKQTKSSFFWLLQNYNRCSKTLKAKSII